MLEISVEIEDHVSCINCCRPKQQESTCSCEENSTQPSVLTLTPISLDIISLMTTNQGWAPGSYLASPHALFSIYFAGMEATTSAYVLCFPGSNGRIWWDVWCGMCPWSWRDRLHEQPMATFFHCARSIGHFLFPQASRIEMSLRNTTDTWQKRISVVYSLQLSLLADEQSKQGTYNWVFKPGKYVLKFFAVDFLFTLLNSARVMNDCLADSGPQQLDATIDANCTKMLHSGIWS